MVRTRCSGVKIGAEEEAGASHLSHFHHQVGLGHLGNTCVQSVSSQSWVGAECGAGFTGEAGEAAGQGHSGTG